MGRIFHPSYTVPVPAGARIRTRHGRQLVTLTVGGQARECPVRRGRAVVTLADRWAVQWVGADGTRHTKTVGSDKRTATAALARYEEQALRAKYGLPDHAADADARSRPLSDLVEEYLAVLAGADTSPAYRATAKQHLKSIRLGCGWQSWADVTRDSLTVYLGKLRDTPAVGKKGERRGRSPATLNAYMRTAKAFCNWYAEKLTERSPLKGLKPYPEARDRRRNRRVPSEGEFGKLLAATEAAPRRHNTLVPPADRAMLYLVAGLTGLRASELERLTPASFDLAAATATVFGKDKREESVTLPAHFLEKLGAWLAGKKPHARLWPGKWAAHRRQVRWLKSDCRRAGLGAGVTFHGLRRKYVTNLIRAGNDVDVVRRMARHKDLRTTLDYYAVSGESELKKAADSLPTAPSPYAPLTQLTRPTTPHHAPKRSRRSVRSTKNPLQLQGA